MTEWTNSLSNVSHNGVHTDTVKYKTCASVTSMTRNTSNHVGMNFCALHMFSLDILRMYLENHSDINLKVFILKKRISCEFTAVLSLLLENNSDISLKVFNLNLRIYVFTESIYGEQHRYQLKNIQIEVKNIRCY